MRACIHPAVENERDPVSVCIFTPAALQLGLLEMLKLVPHARAAQKGRVAQFQQVAVAVKDQVIATHEDDQEQQHEQRDREEPPERSTDIAGKECVQSKPDHAKQQGTEYRGKNPWHETQHQFFWRIVNNLHAADDMSARLADQGDELIAIMDRDRSGAEDQHQHVPIGRSNPDQQRAEPDNHSTQ